ncbi:hypothetical protein [uncultured Chryseobacterium sp.]|uniref:hypothetical protein n=1 Tax=uncultured Chryseobacterium sp. TaxID=259322 RepID=UPI0025E88643|nr:hypothetical protein [uncultured Chryseobacterium sp.]
MLFKDVHLKGIREGKITLAFRQWQKASVKKGSLLNTSVGLLKIDSNETVHEDHITDDEALQAGFTNKKQLLKSFHHNHSGEIFKIALHYHAEDPRIKLREQAELSDQQFEDISRKLERLDQYCKNGQWTKQVLVSIKDHPHLPAAGIANLTGFEKEWLKLNIRKLKNMGLTISHTVGYEISPLGSEYLKKLTESKK